MSKSKKKAHLHGTDEPIFVCLNILGGMGRMLVGYTVFGLLLPFYPL